MANRILGMGDVLTLIERAQDEMDQEEAARAGQRLMEGSFNLEDFLQQMQQIKRLGPLGKVLDLMPGMSQLTQGADLSDMDSEVKRVEAIIYSMTPEERRNPRVLKASRKRRVARGSGTSVQEVNQLLRQFKDMQRMMKQLQKGRGGLARLLGGRSGSF